MVVGAMTDPKGDRSKGPADQPDPDQYVRIVGAGASDGCGDPRGQTAHDRRGQLPRDPDHAHHGHGRTVPKDYAMVCSLPVDAPGVTMIFGRQASDGRRDKRTSAWTRASPRFGAVGGEAVIVFEDVFVPWENVYMDGETDFTGSPGLSVRRPSPGQLRGLQDRPDGCADRARSAT